MWETISVILAIVSIGLFVKAYLVWRENKRIDERNRERELKELRAKVREQ